MINNFVSKLFEIEKEIKTAEHLIYKAFPVIREQKMILRAFESLNRASIKNISLILKAEYFLGNIKLGKDSVENLKMFFERSGEKYGLDEREIKILREIIHLGKKHRNSEFEIVKNDKVAMESFILVWEELENILIFVRNYFRILTGNLVLFLERYKYLFCPGSLVL